MSSEKWVKRDEVPSAADAYSDIWDGDGWQINKTKDNRDKPFLLLDAVQPCWVPASGLISSFATLGEAMAHADALGRPDWSGVPTDEEFYADEIKSATQEPPMSSDVKIPEWAMEEGLRLANDSELSLVTYESSGSEIEEATKSDAKAIALALLAAEQRGRKEAVKEVQELLRQGAPHSPRRYIYDPSPDRRIWACDRLDAAIRSLGEKP